MTEQIVIKTEALTKTYVSEGIETPALRGVDLQIRKGEFSALAGPSGSGKSTLLHLVGGLLEPTSGVVWVEDQLLGELNPNELALLRLTRIGFVFQAYNLMPVLTALENTQFVMELQGLDSSERNRRALEIMKVLDIEEYADRYPNKLSGGQQQRVAVARAVAAQPSVVLADEPTANLDTKNSEKLMDMMRKLNRDKNVTFLFSSHDPLILERVDRVINLVDGVIESDISKQEHSTA